MASRLILYTREGCGLCDDLLAEARPVAARYGLTIESVDIDREPGLRAQHNTRIPVLLLDGEEICHHFFDRAALERALAGMTSHG